MIDETFWKNKKVLLTGHTGFKGSWLSLWLQVVGAEVYGFSLPVSPSGSLYEEMSLDNIEDRRGSIADEKEIASYIKEIEPDILIHMAAQALVRDSYKDPLETFLTNVQGTANVMEGIRRAESIRAAIVVTSDKCYDNKEWIWAYREDDRLGGHDPYSSSKACAELVVQSYRKSYFSEPGEVALATARGGNVVGGGDVSVDRIVPDMVRAYMSGNHTLHVRNPAATRPWQHVLDCLSGYMLLAQHLYADGHKFAEAWNFGPENDNVRTVQSLVDMFQTHYGGGLEIEYAPSNGVHEAMALTLDSSKAKKFMGWRPTLPFEETIAWTASWYRDVNYGNIGAREKTEAQIKEFMLRQKS